MCVRAAAVAVSVNTKGVSPVYIDRQTQIFKKRPTHCRDDWFSQFASKDSVNWKLALINAAICRLTFLAFTFFQSLSSNPIL